MPKASAETSRELASLSTDCSFLLTHLVRQNGNPEKTDQDAKGVLQSILGLLPSMSQGGGPILRGGVVGWYGSTGALVLDPVTSEFNTAPVPKGVCFTESTLAGLLAHHRIFGAKYGVAFDRDWLFSRGANPCLNIRMDTFKTEVCPGPNGIGKPCRYKKVYNYIPTQLHPFVNIINQSFDATHEREWRQPDDLTFAYSDIRFVFCPERDFATFACIQRDGLPTLFDLTWLNRV